MSGSELSCVVFGAGALGLGFLGPEFAPGCRVTFVDIPARADLICHLQTAGCYTANVTGLSVQALTVANVDGLVTGAEETEVALASALDEADLVVTSVGESNLPKLAPLFAAAAGRRAEGRPLRVVCAENGVDIAKGLRAAVEAAAAGPLGRSFVVADTVMGRMCKIVPDPHLPIQPVAPGLSWAVVAEPFFGVVVEEHAAAGMERVPACLDCLPPPRFAVAEDVKMLAHNGLHAFLACLGHLAGRLRFAQLRSDAEIMAMARRLLVDEAGRALAAKHGPMLERNVYLNYCDSILRRITCPVLDDSIARGTRGILRKLAPTERLVYSLRTVARQGIEPVCFATGIAAAVAVAQQTGETDLEFDQVLTSHCGLDPERDADLLALVRSKRRA